MKKGEISKLVMITTVGIIALIILLMTSGCDTTYASNKSPWQTNHFDKAIIYVGGEWLDIEIDSWADFEDGDQLQITSKDGVSYLVHSTNCTLINTGDHKEA